MRGLFLRAQQDIAGQDLEVFVLNLLDERHGTINRVFFKIIPRELRRSNPRTVF